NRAAFADENGFPSETFLQGGLRFLKNRRAVGSGPGLARAQDVECAYHGFWQELAHVLFDELGDALGILARNEPGREFRVGLGGDDRFCALALVAAPDSVQFERRTRPELLDDGEALFPAVSRGAHGLLECFLVPRQGVQRLALLARQLGDAVVETG